MIKITNYGDRAEIYITGIVIDDTDANWLQKDENGKIIGYTYPAEIKAQLDSLSGLPILVRVSSDGGDVGAGIAIYNFLKEHNAKVVAHIDKWAASIASYICFAAEKIEMPSNVYMMIHNPKAAIFGSAMELRSTADWLDKLQNMLVDTYAQGDDSKKAYIQELMDKETWLTADECVELFGDKIELQEATELKAVACYSSIKSAPKALIADNNITCKIIKVLEGAYGYEKEG